MSTLTKVFTLLVSILAILLCGVVVTYIATSSDYKSAYTDQLTRTEAAVAHAESSRIARESDLEIFKNKMLVKDNLYKLAAAQRDELTRELTVAKQEAATAASNATTSQESLNALTLELKLLRESQAELFANNIKCLNAQQEAQTKQEQMSLKLNSKIVENTQLATNLKRVKEQKVELESDIEKLNVKLTAAKATSRPMVNTNLVSMSTPIPAGVPIRGEIIEVKGNLVAISVGSSSGVRTGTRFTINQDGKFLGYIKINLVEPGESVGKLINPQGIIAKGNVVTTGFD